MANPMIFYYNDVLSASFFALAVILKEPVITMRGLIINP
jgi:hypothetical protein